MEDGYRRVLRDTTEQHPATRWRVLALQRSCSCLPELVLGLFETQSQFDQGLLWLYMVIVRLSSRPPMRGRSISRKKEPGRTWPWTNYPDIVYARGRKRGPFLLMIGVLFSLTSCSMPLCIGYMLGPDNDDVRLMIFAGDVPGLTDCVFTDVAIGQ
ncbi:hypothetical protein ACGC1H_001928 [Rhizoctonia solani]